MENKKAIKTFAVLIGVLTFLSFLIFFPQIREIIIHFGEKYIGRPLSHEEWHKRFIMLEIQFLICSLPFYIFLIYMSFSKTSIFCSPTEGIFRTRNEQYGK